MSKEVNAAVGTQRQFAKQPEMPYALRLNDVNFSGGIHERTDYDAQLLAKSLGVIPKAILNLHASIERGKQENATLVNADKILAGKTKEDLQKFDRMATLQNVEGHNMSHNKYAMAALEQGIGKMASNYAKQEWSGLPESEKPKSVAEAVQKYNEILQENYNQFGENIQNRTAFDKGYYEGAMADTMKVANEADARIDDDKRQKMVMLASTEIQDLIYQGTTGEDFANNLGMSLRKLQLGSRDRNDFMKNVMPLMKMICEQDHTTERLNAIADYMYDSDSGVKDMMNLYPYYQKIANNFDIRVAEDIYTKATRADGTLDVAYANKLLAELPAEFANGVGVPSQMLPVAGGGELNAPENMKGALGTIGGALMSLGLSNAQFSPTSTNPNGVAIDLGTGNLSQDKQSDLKSYFGQFFGDVSIGGDAENGYSLQLGDYKGGMKAANPKEATASAFTSNRIDNIRRRFMAKNNDMKREKARRTRREHEDVSVAALSAMSSTEAIDGIYNSAYLPNEMKEAMIDEVCARDKRITRMLMSGSMSPSQYGWYQYEKGLGKYSLARDHATIRQWEQALKDPKYNTTDPALIKEFNEIQEDADEAADRRNKYWYFSSGGNYMYGDGQPSKASTQGANNRTYTQAEIESARKWVSSNPKRDDGSPLTHEQILSRLFREGGEALIDAVFSDTE